jgi:Flp pilus assembly protein TadD
MPPRNIFQRPAPRIAAPLDPLLGFELRRALMLHQSGQAEEAARIYAQILRAHPEQFDCLHFLAVAHLQAARPDEALPLLDRAVEVRPGEAAAHASRALALNGLGRHADALLSADRALALRPGMPEALKPRAVALAALKQAAGGEAPDAG